LNYRPRRREGRVANHSAGRKRKALGV